MKKILTILSFLAISTWVFAQPNITMKDAAGTNIRSDWSHHIGYQPIMTQGPWKSLVIKNAGTADLVLANPSTWEVSEAVPGATSEFEWNFTQVSTTIAPGDSTFVYVRFTPKTEGGKCIWIKIPNNDPDATENPFILIPCGTCTTPDISVHASWGSEDLKSYTFYSVPVGFSSNPAEFSIRAHGISDGIRLLGTPKIQKVSGNINDFVIDESSTASFIEVYGWTWFTITFRPLTTGKKSMVVRIPNSDFNEGDYYFTVYAKTGNLRGNGRMDVSGEFVNEEEVDDDSENQRTAYPNPSDKNFTIQTGGTSDEQVAARIFNSAGTLTEKFQWPGASLQTVGDEWKSGLYLLEIRSSTGRKVIKLVKK